MNESALTTGTDQTSIMISRGAFSCVACLRPRPGGREVMSEAERNVIR